MSVSTVRPDSTVLNEGTLTGAATAHGAVSDDSDSSYVTLDQNDDLRLGTANPTIPAGAVLKTWAVRVRAAKTGSNVSLSMSLPFVATGTSITWSSPTTITLGSGSAAGVTTAELNAAELALLATVNNGLRVHEAYLDVTYVAKPVVVVTAPVTPISDTNLPVVTWSTTTGEVGDAALDSDGGPRTTFEVKVFTDAQYGAGGFDPDTSTPFETSGEVSSAAATWTPSTLQPDDTYRAYVRVAQTVNGSLHWSDWDYLEYVLAVDLPAVPTLTLTEDENDGRIVIDLDDNAGDATTDDFELQRSTDGGTTWEAVRLTTDTAGIITGTSATIYDYEAPNGVATMYRARARHTYPGGDASSAWATGTVTFSTRDVWLKAPERPSLNVVVQVDSYASRQRPARRGVFQPLGRTYPVVVRDTRQSWAGTVRIRLDTDEDQAPIDALLDSGLTLLLQVPDRYHEPDRYVQMGDQGRDRLVDKGMVEGVVDTLAWVEVAAPTGVVDAWPAGTS